MELRPKYSLHTLTTDKHSALREFTDREEPTQAFMDAMEKKLDDQYKVLTYYGVGGIGKSRLLQELNRKLARREPSAIRAILNFKEAKHRTPSEALIWLREELKKHHKIKFTTFDLAYIIYWKKLNPQVSLKSRDEAIPFLEEGSFIGEVIDQLENVPVAQWFPKTLKFISGMAKYKDILQWWMKSGMAVLEQLQDMLPNEIEELLPVYWAEDLKGYLQSSPAQAVLFIDTYEALWENSRQQGSFYDKDAWVQELVLQLPEVLWVICGREKIQWGKTNAAWNDRTYLEQHLMGALSAKDSDKFLQSCGIASTDVRSVIIDASHGLPYHLDLMVDTYKLLEQRHEPQPHEFSKSPQKILDRFLVYLELSEKETLKVLSFTRHWTVELFRHLVAEFGTGFPPTAYLELFRFSFITKEGPAQWEMHVMMRTSLQEQVQQADADLCHHVHTVLFDYYEKKLTAASETNDRRIFFEEAFYHGKLALEPSDFLDWFLTQGKKLKNAGQFELLSVLYDKLPDMSSQHPKGNINRGAVHQFYGEIYLLQGNYEQALIDYHKAQQNYQNELGGHSEAIVSHGRCSIDLAEIHIQQGHYDEAYALLIEGGNQLNRYTGQLDEAYYTSKVIQAVRLGKLNLRFARYDEARDNYHQAIATGKKASEDIRGSGGIYALMALAYEKLGELMATERNAGAEQCYTNALDYDERALQGSAAEDIKTSTHMGLVHKRLGEFYCAAQRPADAIQSYTRALSIYDQVLEQSPDFVDALEKQGHAAVDYMALQIKLNLLEEALETFTKAVEAFTDAIELSPKQGASRNRLASAHRELGVLHMKRGEAEKAIGAFTKSLRLSDIVLEKTPDYIYAHNSIGKTHEQLAEVHKAAGRKEMADVHIVEALNHFHLMLARSPGLVEATERIASINKSRG